MFPEFTLLILPERGASLRPGLLLANGHLASKENVPAMNEELAAQAIYIKKKIELD